MPLPPVLGHDGKGRTSGLLQIHTISIRATDQAGNVGRAATVEFTVIRKG